jgi:hypothetical protein
MADTKDDEEMVTLARMARMADVPHQRARTILRALREVPDITVPAGRATMWLFRRSRLDSLVAQLRTRNQSPGTES